MDKTTPKQPTIERHKPHKEICEEAHLLNPNFESEHPIFKLSPQQSQILNDTRQMIANFATSCADSTAQYNHFYTMGLEALALAVNKGDYEDAKDFGWVARQTLNRLRIEFAPYRKHPLHLHLSALHCRRPWKKMFLKHTQTHVLYRKVVQAVLNREVLSIGQIQRAFRTGYKQTMMFKTMMALERLAFYDNATQRFVPQVLCQKQARLYL